MFTNHLLSLLFSNYFKPGWATCCGLNCAPKSQIHMSYWSPKSECDYAWRQGLYRSESEVAQSCPTLCDPMGCSPPGSFTHGIFQARVVEWVAISFSRGSSDPGIEPGSPTLQRTRDQIANIHWIIKKSREFQKNIYFCITDYAKAFDCVVPGSSPGWSRVFEGETA